MLLFGLIEDLSKDPVLSGFWHILDFNWGNPSENRGHETDHMDVVQDDTRDVPEDSDAESSEVPLETHESDEYGVSGIEEPNEEVAPSQDFYLTPEIPADPDLKSEMPSPAADASQPAEDLEANKRRKLLDNIRGLRMGTVKNLG